MRKTGTRAMAVAGALIAVGALAAACTSATPNVGKGNGKVTGKPLKGGTVTIAEVGASPNFIFPYPPSTNSDGYNVNLTEGLWPYLVYAGDGAKAVVNPDESLFSSLKYSNNNSVITIVLKPWNWSDGVPITSRDFTFVYNLLKVNYKNWIGYTQGLFPTDVKKITTPDSHTIVLDLDRSYNPTFYTDNVLALLALMPQHAWDKTSATGKVGNYDETAAGAKAVYSFLQKQGTQMSTFDSNPLWKVVYGPWTLQTFNSNGFYAWVPNKHYSGPDKPKLDKVVWTPFTTDTAEMNTLRSGTTLDLGGLPLNDVGQIPALEAEGYTVDQLPTAGVAEIVPNLYNPVNGPLLRQLYVRQVLEYLFNRPEIVKKVFNGYADPGNGPIPLLYGKQWVSPLERAGGPYPYSPSKAIALLKAHGWKVVPHGVSTCQHPGTGANECGAGVKAGEPMQFQLMYSSGSTSFDQQNASIQSTEAAAGVKIVLDPVPFNTIVSTTGYCNEKSHPTSTCSWQLQDYGYNPYTLDPAGAGQFNTDGYGNYGGYSSAKENSLIDATVHGSASSDFFAYEDYTARQLPYLWLPNEAGVFVYKKNLAGITPWNPFSGTLNPELWYYTKPTS
ncbi:MAG TPA: ABC transporter substrate-binding protein [Streptosporangiaceae bacterium]|nr:ABC transporter substrate-binding protein [Streptosporangiaceae bacterium]